MEHINNLISENYLMHHGVKGMKWGVRNEQRKQANRQFRSDIRKARKKQLKTFVSKDYFNRNKRREANSTFRKEYKQARSKQIKTYKDSYKISPQTKQKIKAAAYIGGTIAAGALATYGSYKITDQAIKLKSMETQQQLNRMRQQMNNTKYIGYTYSLY